MSRTNWQLIGSGAAVLALLITGGVIIRSNTGNSSAVEELARLRQLGQENQPTGTPDVKLINDVGLGELVTRKAKQVAQREVAKELDTFRRNHPNPLMMTAEETADLAILERLNKKLMEELTKDTPVITNLVRDSSAKVRIGPTEPGPVAADLSVFNR